MGNNEGLFPWRARGNQSACRRKKNAPPAHAFTGGTPLGGSVLHIFVATVPNAALNESPTGLQRVATVMTHVCSNTCTAVLQVRSLKMKSCTVRWEKYRVTYCLQNPHKESHDESDTHTYIVEQESN